MASRRFNSDEVRRLLGRSVCSLTVLSGVPKGTTGRVVAAEEMEPDKFDLIVEWDIFSFDMPDKDHFDHEQFDHCLIET